MNKTLFRMEWKSAWKLLLIFILILAMYFSIMLTMFERHSSYSGGFLLNLSVWHDHDYVPVFVFCYSLPATACQKGG